MCQTEVGRNRHFKSVSKGQQETQTVWILAGRKWRDSFACPLNDHSAAPVFRNAFHFGSISARVCPAGPGLGKDWVYAVEKPVLPASVALLLAPSGLVCSLCGLYPKGLHRCNFYSFSSQNKTSFWFTAQEGDASWMGLLAWRSLQNVPLIGQEGNRLSVCR